MIHHVTLHGVVGATERFLEHTAFVIVGFAMMVLGLALGVTMIMLPVGIVVGLVGVLLVVGGLFGHIDQAE
jgi:hypothetical protein